MKSIEILDLIVQRSGVRGSIFYYEDIYNSTEEFVKHVWGDDVMFRVHNLLKGESILVTYSPLSSLSEKAPLADVVVGVIDGEDVGVRYIYNLID